MSEELAIAATRRRTILIVDDDPKIVATVVRYMEHAGFATVTAANGLDALSLARQRRPALVVLDRMLPGLDGMTVCRTLRRENALPIVMLTAKTLESDRLDGLDSGADDYVIKPFSPRELVARVRAVLRRVDPQASAKNVLRMGELVINIAEHEVLVRGCVVNLTTAELNLLHVLARTPGRVFTRRELVDAVFGWDRDSDERSIDVHVKNLRRKIEPDRSRPRFIETIHGRGYKFVRPRDQ